ncbi:hypothetical protein [Nocardia sp. NPDC005366]|uniref:hypothetical protein n=1 Tax=Nocardia sp. NPDC005366 TaxID=3156878 RepID=UPI0033A0C04C
MAVDSATAKLPGIMVPITTDDLETVNGLSWVLGKGVIKPGATVGVVAMEGSAGDNTVVGAKFVAKRHNLELVLQRINPPPTPT